MRELRQAVFRVLNATSAYDLRRVLGRRGKAAATLARAALAGLFQISAHALEVGAQRRRDVAHVVVADQVGCSVVLRAHEPSVLWNVDAALAQPGALTETAARSLAERLAELWSEQGDEGRVVAMLQRQVAAAPADAELFERLKSELTSREEWLRLSDAYDIAVAAAPTARKCDLLAEAAILREELANDLAGAMRAYEQLLALDSTYSDAQYALEKLYERTGRDSELAALLTPRAAVDPHVARRLAGLLDLRLSRTTQAIPVYIAALTADAEHGARLFAIAEGGIDTERIADALAAHFELAGGLVVDSAAKPVPCAVLR